MIALLTDFGAEDVYVGVMKAVIAGIAPGARVIDLAHGVPPQSIAAGAWWLAAAWSYLPPGTIVVAVVDPGVGTSRRAIAAQVEGRLLVGPDNGLFSLLPQGTVREIDPVHGLPSISATFPGRALFAPAAARLASGLPFSAVGPLVGDPVRLTLEPQDDANGTIVYADRFGNLVTNLPGRSSGSIEFDGRVVPVVRTYGDAGPGALVALTGSGGRIELSRVGGNAAQAEGGAINAPVRWRP